VVQKHPIRTSAQPRPSGAPLVINTAKEGSTNLPTDPTVVANTAAQSELPTPCSVEDVRAARVQRFELPPVPPPADDRHTIIEGSGVRPYGQPQSGFSVPVGIACIDLTDD
jgi:hypothetical protein